MLLKKKDPLWAMTVFGIMTAGITLLDITIIRIFIKRRTVRENHTNKLVLNLLIADSVTLVNAWSFMFTTYDYIKDSLPQLTVLTTNLAICALTMCGVTFDRFIAIVFPLRYKSIVGQKLILTVILASWGLPITAGAITYILYATQYIELGSFLHYRPAATLCVWLIAVAMLLTCNAVIFYHTRKLIKRTPAPTAAKDDNTTAQPSFQDRLDLKKQRQRKQQVRAAYLCSLIVLSFTILWLPEVVFLFQFLLDSSGKSNRRAYLVALTCIYVNVYFDTILYVLMNKELRFEILENCRQKRARELLRNKLELTDVTRMSTVTNPND